MIQRKVSPCCIADTVLIQKFMKPGHDISLPAKAEDQGKGLLVQPLVIALSSSDAKGTASSNASSNGAGRDASAAEACKME